MSDHSDKVQADPPNKVSPLPTPLARHIEFVNQVLEKSDGELSQNNSADLQSEKSFDKANRTELQQAGQEPVGHAKPLDGTDAIVEALIGLGLMLIGLATMVAVAFLTRRALTPIFVGAGLVLLGGGAWRFDRATRLHRMARHQMKVAKRNR